MIAAQDALNLLVCGGKRLPQHRQCPFGRGLTAHENIGSGKAVFGPGVNRDMRFGQQQYASDALILAKMVKMRKQDVGTGSLGTFVQDVPDATRIAEQVHCHTL